MNAPACPDFNAQPDLGILEELASAPRPWALRKFEDSESWSTWTILDGEGFQVAEIEIESERERAVLQFMIDAVNLRGAEGNIQHTTPNTQHPMAEVSVAPFPVEDVKTVEGHA